MKSTSHAFKRNALEALQNVTLQKALTNVKRGFIDKRKLAMEALPEFPKLRLAARDIKQHTLAHLDSYLEQFEQQVIANGGQVHWARNALEAQQVVAQICADAGARSVTKGKSMVSEEVALNEALEQAGYEIIETDLGEYIIQLAQQPPSHIIAPAVHMTRQEIVTLFRKHHQAYGFDSALETVPEIVDEARKVLREKFLNADVGITGANFLIAETGSTIIVTNEGNGDLTASLPNTHIVISSIEKVVPTLEDTSVFLRLLARSATGQAMTAYTTFFTGPKRAGDLDGPESFHVVLVDNGRTDMLDSEFHDMLRCIRCGACLNHCPIYSNIGGHAYGWVYPGPMGSVLTPLMTSLQEGQHLPQASTFCGRCEEVCPVAIPLPRLLREHRNREHRQKIIPRSARLAIASWAWLARHPALYRFFSNRLAGLLSVMAGKHGSIRNLPMARGWTASRDLPAPQGASFMQRYRQSLRTGQMDKS